MRFNIGFKLPLLIIRIIFIIYIYIKMFIHSLLILYYHCILLYNILLLFVATPTPERCHDVTHPARISSPPRSQSATHCIAQLLRSFNWRFRASETGPVSLEQGSKSEQKRTPGKWSVPSKERGRTTWDSKNSVPCWNQNQTAISSRNFTWCQSSE